MLHTQNNIVDSPIFSDVKRYLNVCPHAAWCSDYRSQPGEVIYSNQEFANFFSKTPEEIVALKTYEAINGPSAPNAKYIADDQIAMEKGLLLLRENSPLLTVAKLGIGNAVLGICIKARSTDAPNPSNLESELITTIRHLIDLRVWKDTGRQFQ